MNRVVKKLMEKWEHKNSLRIPDRRVTIVKLEKDYKRKGSDDGDNNTIIRIGE